MTLADWIQLVQTTRLVLLGAVLPLLARALWGIPRGRPDPAARLTATGAAFIALLLIGQVIAEAPLGGSLVKTGLQLQYFAAIGSIPMILGVVLQAYRPPSPHTRWVPLALLGLVGALVLIPGAIFSGGIVTRVIPLGYPLLALEPGPLHIVMPVIGLAAGTSALLRVRRAENPDEKDFRLLVRVGALTLVPAGIHDALVNQGILFSIPVLGVACVVTVVAYAAAFARRARLAHGNLQERVRVRTEALRKKNLEILEAERRVALGTLSAGVGHELNNPLAIVSANVGTISQLVRERGGLGDVGATLERQLLLATSACRALREAIVEMGPEGAGSEREGDTAPRSSERERRRARILVIDDEPAVGRAVKRSLRGHDVTLAQSGLEALRLVRTSHFDLVLCDVMMPGMTGPEVYDTLRREGAASLSQFVFFTGGAFDPEIARRVRQSGVLVLPKPVSPEQLARVVARAFTKDSDRPAQSTTSGSSGEGA